MHVKKLVLLLFLILPLFGFSQIPELSPLSKISVLTCGSGDELYATFGHSAFRVQDRALGIDVVYNYGVFDFRTRNFYGKFAKGKLDYTLARQQSSRFLQEYKYENRWVNEQQLSLSQDERNKLFKYLETNYLPENRGYQYDFFYNNCATKIWDVLDGVFGDQLKFNQDYLDNTFTHRALIRQNMPTNSWACFGIDLALGSVIDNPATPKEHMFLPEYIMQQLNTAKLDSTLVAPKQKALFTPNATAKKVNFLYTPLFWSLVFMIIVVTITFKDHKKGIRSSWVDFLLFFITGVAGVVIFFLWFMTDHTATARNFNILWAFPLNLNLAFLVFNKRPIAKWKKGYLILLVILLLLVPIIWLSGIQIFSPVILPILIALLTRYLYLYTLNRTIKK